MTSNTPKKKSDVEVLAEALDGTNRQRAEAIADFVDGRISGLRDELAGLVGRQKESISVAKAEGSPEVKASVNTATQAVKEADKAVKAAESDPTPEKTKAAKAKVEEAEKSVSKTESDLATRMGKAETKLGSHEERICALEEGQTGLAASVDGLWVSVRAHAHALTTGGGAVTGLRRAGRLMIATFVAIIAIWALIVLVSPVTLSSWNIGIGLAAVAAGLVFAWLAATMGDDIPAQAEAQADAGVDVVRQSADTL